MASNIKTLLVRKGREKKKITKEKLRKKRKYILLPFGLIKINLKFQ